MVDDSEVTVKEKDTILEPDENGVYTLKADFEKYIDRKIIIRDAGGNSATYMNDIRMNTLDRRDNPAPLNLPNGAEYKANAPVTVNADITAKALWKDSVITPTTYTVTVTDDGNGTAYADPSTAKALTEITLTATPNGGYRFKEWQVIGGGVTIADNKLIMPEGNVEVRAVFEQIPDDEFTVTFDGNGGTPTVGSMTTTDGKLASLPNASRADYGFDGWYTEKSGGTKITADTVFSADTTVYAHWSYTGGDGSQGAGGSAFDSGGNATRGEAAAAIWRMEGSPAPKGRSIFIDVDAKHQYAAPITWAAENGICMGCGDGRFGPNDPLTREQLAFTFYRYARYKGYDTTAKGNTDTFGDADKIMPYAKPAMQWAAGSGLIQAKFGNRLDPQGTVSRAELTAMRDRFIKKYGLVQGIAPGGLTGWIDPKRLQIPQTGDSGAWGIYGFALCASLAAGVALITFRLRRRREKAPLQGAEK